MLNDAFYEYEDEEVLPFEIDGRWVGGILYFLQEDGTVRVDGIDTDAIGSTSVTIPGNVTIEGKADGEVSFPSSFLK